MRWIFIGLYAASLAFAGCTTNSQSMFKAWSPVKDADYADPTSGKDDPWTSQAGSVGRADRPLEKSEEPRWFRKAIMSDRAREIEANLGVTD